VKFQNESTIKCYYAINYLVVSTVNTFTTQVKVRFTSNIPNYLLQIPCSLEQTRSTFYLNHSGNANDTRRTAISLEPERIAVRLNIVNYW